MIRGWPLGALLLCLLVGCAAPPAKLVILHMNDFHGQIRPLATTPRPGITKRMGGFAALESVVQRVRAEVAAAGGAMWLTSGGDWFQGTPEGNEDKGWSLMACRNRLGITAAAVGNHEFDFGEKNLARVIGRADHPVLAANILDAHGTLRHYVQPYRIVRVGSVRVAILGLITQRTPKVSTGPFGEAVFANVIESIRRWLPELERQSDAVVLVTHCGVDKDTEIAEAFPSIDLILGGHSHTPLPLGKKVGTCWIAQSGGKGTALSRVEIDLDQVGRQMHVRSVRLIPVPEADVIPNRARDRFLKEAFGHVGAKWDQPVGRVIGAPHKAARTLTSTPGGNYVADLMRRVAKADLGFTNKGGLRSAVSSGPITRRQVFEFLPFDNTIVTLEMTGEHLRTLLSQGLRSGRLPLEVSGGVYEFKFVDGERVLGDVFVDGKPILSAHRYRVATNSFLAGGGDGFTIFQDAVTLSETKDWIRDAMLEDLRTERAGITFPADRRIVRID